MKCEKTGKYTVLMDGRHWCQGCRDYHELNRSHESGGTTSVESFKTPAASLFSGDIEGRSQHCE
jgi:hypothetical protein